MTTPGVQPAPRRRKVAILGGGVGAISAAFELTSPRHGPNRFDVTIYQTGWRLGGKCASGRNGAERQRIEEHGLHVWSGFYDNAIRLMRECYAELAGAPGVFPSFEAAFSRHDNIALGEPRGTGWGFWQIRPPVHDRPKLGFGAIPPLTYLRLLAEMLADMMRQEAAAPFARHVHPDPRIHGPVAVRVQAEAGRAGPVEAGRLMAETARALEAEGSPSLEDLSGLSDLANRHREGLAEGHRRLAAEGPLHPDLARLRILLDLGGTVIRGMLADGVVTRGFGVIEDCEFSDWISRHGAHPETVDSPVVKAVYDYAFGYRDGICDRSHRAIAAGTFIAGSLRLLLTYDGTIFLKMNAGMGDTIFTPYYKALVRRGVTFRFFHEVRALRLDPGGARIDAIEIDRQATVPEAGYDPFVSVRGLDCWPSEPNWSQIAEAEALRAGQVNLESPWKSWPAVEKVTLRRGADFDDVVLGIPIGTFPDIAADLIAEDPMWARMVERVRTVGTEAMQLWHKPGDIGWPDGDTILTAYADNLNTWADMTHLRDREDWPDALRPGRISYFCGPTRDPAAIPKGPAPGYRAGLLGTLRSEAAGWLAANGAALFPGVMRDGALDPARLVTARTDTDPWQAQYFRKNIEPSERYVLSVPGSASARLRADRSGFDNLWLAGDWTWTAINAGCVEAATMSGIRAAAGLAGRPVRIVGEDPDPVTDSAGPPPGPAIRTIRPQNSAWPWSVAYGMAQTTGAVAMLALPRARVAAMLPAGLVPGPAPAGLAPAPDSHPVVLLMARQRDVRPNLMPFGMNYLECVLTVPWVRHVAPDLAGLGPLACPVRLYLDSLPPILLGIYGYGFPKLRARMAADHRSYSVADARDGRAILSAMFIPAGPEQRAHEIAPFAITRTAFEMVMVTRNKLGRWQYSVFDFGLGQSRLTPLKLSLRIEAHDLGPPAGRYAPPTLAESPLGAFLLRTDGTINNPLQSHALLRQLREAQP